MTSGLVDTEALAIVNNFYRKRLEWCGFRNMSLPAGVCGGDKAAGHDTVSDIASQPFR